VIGGAFKTVGDPWIDERWRRQLQATLGPALRSTACEVSGFHASAFSPTLVATTVGSGGATPVIITGAVPAGEGCEVRVAVASPHEGPKLDRMVEGARKAISQDVVVWDNLDPAALSHYDDSDGPVLAFQQFCAEFALLPEDAFPRSYAVR
jgi:hypothetical protein